MGKRLLGFISKRLGLDQTRLVNVDCGLYSIGGNIPDELGVLVKLQFLELFGNIFNRPIPSTIGRFAAEVFKHWKPELWPNS